MRCCYKLKLWRGGHPRLRHPSPLSLRPKRAIEPKCPDISRQGFTHSLDQRSGYLAGSRANLVYPDTDLTGLTGHWADAVDHTRAASPSRS